MNKLHSQAWRWALSLGVLVAIAYSAPPSVWRSLRAQEPVDPAAVSDGGPSAAPAPVGQPGAAAPDTTPDQNSINIWRLYWDGGIFMHPIAAFSLLAAIMTIERLLGLRKEKVLPEGLVTALGQLGSSGGFDPRKAYRLCQQYPSPAANVVRAMLLKVGRPLSEIEQTVKEASEREANRTYSNVRWLNLSASVSPLLGLLGTVQGMILAFHTMTVIAPGVDKATALASGIYTALVTTFAGLVVAIPAAIFSHYFEGRITVLFEQIDEMTASLLPQVERYEGRVRFSRGAENEAAPVATQAEAADRGKEPVPAAAKA